jgi:hypothetical protein
MFDEIKAALPGAIFFDRTSMNSWEDSLARTFRGAYG